MAWHDKVILCNQFESFREGRTVVLVDWAVLVDIVDFFLCGGLQLFVILAKGSVIYLKTPGC